LKKIDGVKDAKADYEKAWAWAKYDPSKTAPEKLAEAINKNTQFSAEVKGNSR